MKWEDVKTLTIGTCVVAVITVTILLTSCNPEEVVEQAVIEEVTKVKEEVVTKVEEVKTEVKEVKEDIIKEIPQIEEVKDELINIIKEGE